MNKLIFIVKISATQPLMLRTEGIHDVSTRLVGDEEVPAIISRKMTRPLRDTLRSYGRETGDPWINQVCRNKFPTETMCCWCIDCLLFGGTNAKANVEKEIQEGNEKRKYKFNTRMIQLRHIVSPVDALAVTDHKFEAETHVGVKEGRNAEIGQSLYAPFQVPAGTSFIGTLMIDLDAASVTEEKLIKVLATVFSHTKKYGARTAEVGLVAPEILAVVKAPYEFITSYDLYPIVKSSQNGDWKRVIANYLTTCKISIPELHVFDQKAYDPVSKTELIGGEIQQDGKEKKCGSLLMELTEELRNSLRAEEVDMIRIGNDGSKIGRGSRRRS